MDIFLLSNLAKLLAPHAFLNAAPTSNTATTTTASNSANAHSANAAANPVHLGESPSRRRWREPHAQLAHFLIKQSTEQCKHA